MKTAIAGRGNALVPPAFALLVIWLQEAIIGNDNIISTVSTNLKKNNDIKNVYLCFPAVIEHGGIREIFPLHLNELKKKAFSIRGGDKRNNQANRILTLDKNIFILLKNWGLYANFS